MGLFFAMVWAGGLVTLPFTPETLRRRKGTRDE